jgi:transketolase
MISDIKQFAKNIRAEALKMVTRARASHIGGALSMADILAVLYGRILNIDPAAPQMPGRDRFILSKGHSTASLYATLALRGFFPLEELETYGKDDSRLMTHVTTRIPGVEFSTGSLGHGLPFGLGKAIAAKRSGHTWRTFVLTSDGEWDEGSNWEATLAAAHLGLDNLTVIIDYNKIQSLGNVPDILRLEPFAEKFRTFGCAVCEVDGHDIDALENTFARLPLTPGRPTIVLAHTVKGKGVAYMENQLLWHYRNPNEEQLRIALAGLETLK